MKVIDYVKIENPERFLGESLVTKASLEAALKEALIKIDKLYKDLGTDFPSHNSENNIYQPVKNDCGWNTGFWCGILWLAFEATNDPKYRSMAESLLESFYIRIDQKLKVDTHDLGFIFIPSCVAAYKLTGNQRAKEAALKAADHLMTRFNEAGGYIQAWGAVGAQLRLIVDCMNNIPLLYWASEVTGDKKYYNAAKKHAETTAQYIVREDGSTHHTFFFHPDGKPDKGCTHQGANDNSSWSRGQAWLISGLPLTYKYTKDESVIPLFKAVTNFFLNRLPEDFVPYWDLIFKDGDDEEKDSSAGAIAACGILQMLPQLPEGSELHTFYASAVDKIMYSLMEKYNAKHDPESNGLLLHAVYSRRHGDGVDECNIWGCYYYMEALVRMLKGTKAYW